MKGFMQYANVFDLPDIYMDNKSLDGFIDRFVKGGFTCDDHICCSEIRNDKTDCNYCYKWVEKVMRISRKDVEEWNKKADSILEQLNSGDFYKII